MNDLSAARNTSVHAHAHRGWWFPQQQGPVNFTFLNFLGPHSLQENKSGVTWSEKRSFIFQVNIIFEEVPSIFSPESLQPLKYIIEWKILFWEKKMALGFMMYLVFFNQTCRTKAGPKSLEPWTPPSACSQMGWGLPPQAFKSRQPEPGNGCWEDMSYTRQSWGPQRTVRLWGNV